MVAEQTHTAQPMTPETARELPLADLSSAPRPTLKLEKCYLRNVKAFFLSPICD